MKYNIDKEEEDIIPIPVIEEEPLNVIEIKQWGNQIYIFPSDFAKGIYVLDLDRQKITKDEDLSVLFENGFMGSNDVVLFYEESLILAIQGTNEIIEINLRTKQIIDRIRLKENVQIFSIKYDGNHFWILQTESTDVYEWDKEHDTLHRYVNEQGHVEDTIERAYSNKIFLNDEILDLAYSQENILRINKREKTIGEALKNPEAFRCINKIDGIAMYGPYTITENRVFIYPGKGNMMLIYDKNTRQVTGNKFMITEKEMPMIREVLRTFFSEKKMYMERDDIGTLEEFINTVGGMEDADEVQNIGEVGHKIYQECLLM